MGQFISWPPRKQLLATAIVSAVSVLGGSLAGSVLTATKTSIGTVVTQAELDQASTDHSEKHRVLEARVTVVEAAAKSCGERVTVIESKHAESDLARRAAREMLVVEIGKRIRLQAAHEVGSDPRRRVAAERAAAAVGTRYDDLVLRGVEPLVAADRALEYARIAR